MKSLSLEILKNGLDTVMGNPTDLALSRTKVGIVDLRRSLLSADILCFCENNDRDVGPDFLDSML